MVGIGVDHRGPKEVGLTILPTRKLVDHASDLLGMAGIGKNTHLRHLVALANREAP